MPPEEWKVKISVCVIGAGAAGLCALRHFTARPDRFGPVLCFEQSNRLGGGWHYDGNGGGARGPNGLVVQHSRVFRDMR